MFTSFEIWRKGLQGNSPLPLITLSDLVVGRGAEFYRHHHGSETSPPQGLGLLRVTPVQREPRSLCIAKVMESVGHGRPNGTTASSMCPNHIAVGLSSQAGLEEYARLTGLPQRVGSG